MSINIAKIFYDIVVYNDFGHFHFNRTLPVSSLGIIVAFAVQRVTEIIKMKYICAISLKSPERN